MFMNKILNNIIGYNEQQSNKEFDIGIDINDILSDVKFLMRKLNTKVLFII